jgi:tRNA-2-methylthio-N6-dimethylallyladenosine synthase
MNKAFDIGVESLSAAPQSQAGASAIAAVSEPAHDPASEVTSKSFYLETFGCQMNVHDSEKVSGVLLGRGYHEVKTPAEAGLVLYNTCSIRERAAQKVFARIGDWKTTSNGKIIGVLGCLAQQEGEEIFERTPWVSLVCGSASYNRLPELIDQLESGGRRVMGLDLDTDLTFETEITHRDNPFRAYITIIEGCDYSCAYCVVPHTRGPERSRPSDSVLAEARRLADAGYTEIQLLGQTVNSYRDPSPRALSFTALLRAVAEVQGIRRVRFTTSHPNDFHREIIDAIDATPALCDHIHLPVQSGSTPILRAMRRTYTREDYLETISWIRAGRRPYSITSDVIVGFPGETEKDFEDTLSLLDAAQFDAVFAFTYSPRPNTPAQRMADALPEEEKSRRLGVLLEYQRQIQAKRNEMFVGQSFELLVDGHRAARGQWAGRTSCNRIVNFTSPHENLLGVYLQARVTRALPNSLVGEQVV